MRPALARTTLTALALTIALGGCVVNEDDEDGRDGTTVVEDGGGEGGGGEGDADLDVETDTEVDGGGDAEPSPGG